MEFTSIILCTLISLGTSDICSTQDNCISFEFVGITARGAAKSSLCRRGEAIVLDLESSNHELPSYNLDSVSFNLVVNFFLEKDISRFKTVPSSEFFIVRFQVPGKKEKVYLPLYAAKRMFEELKIHLNEKLGETAEPLVNCFDRLTKVVP
jgi:hypothetical protein